MAARRKPSESAKARAEANRRRVPAELSGERDMDSTLMDEIRRRAPFAPDVDFSDVKSGSSSTARRKRRLRDIFKRRSS